MEDVRQRLGGMGLSGVTMEQLSEVEWKLGEIKVGAAVCDRWLADKDVTLFYHTRRVKGLVLF